MFRTARHVRVLTIRTNGVGSPSPVARKFSFKLISCRHERLVKMRSERIKRRTAFQTHGPGKRRHQLLTYIADMAYLEACVPGSGQAAFDCPLRYSNSVLPALYIVI